MDVFTTHCSLIAAHCSRALLPEHFSLLTRCVTPCRYIQLDPNQAQALAWDDAVQQGNEVYRGRMHNLCCDNCHSHVAQCLNLMQYRGHQALGEAMPGLSPPQLPSARLPSSVLPLTLTLLLPLPFPHSLTLPACAC